MAQRLLSEYGVRRLVLLVLSLCLAAVPATAEEFARGVRTDAGGALHIELARGDVEVVSHDGRELRLEAEAHGVGASGVHFTLRETDPGRFVLESSAEDWLAWLATAPRVRVRVFVPRDVALSVATPGRVVARDAGVETALPARLDVAASAP